MAVQQYLYADLSKMYLFIKHDLKFLYWRPDDLWPRENLSNVQIKTQIMMNSNEKGMKH